MINFILNRIKNSLASFNLLNISFNFYKIKSASFELSDTNPIELVQLTEKEAKQRKYLDYKTTLGGWNINLIDNIEDDIIAYLFIQKEPESSAWNLIAPILLEKSTGKINQYGLGYFALQGCGGGLSNTSSIMYHLKKHKEKGYKASVVPKVVDNQLLNSFQYADSGTTLTDLLESSTDLINYRKDKFEWIYMKYSQLTMKYELA
jgi:hypothetical protein